MIARHAQTEYGEPVRPGTSSAILRIDALVISAALAFAPCIALAQEPAAADAGAPTSDANAQAEARTEMRKGLDAYSDGLYELALRHFRRAMELVPEANLPHRHAGKALEALGRWEEAVFEHETYLRIKPNVSDASAVQERIDEIRRTYLVGIVALRCQPEPTEIVIDEDPPAPLTDRNVRLRPGPHVLRIRAPDHAEKKIDVVVQQGTTIAPDCVLVRTGNTLALGPNNPPGAEKPPPARPWYGRWYTWAGAGLVVAGVVTTILLVGANSTTPPPTTEGGNHVFP
jgi:tetratricopeptide (TPR) repeat protein